MNKRFAIALGILLLIILPLWLIFSSGTAFPGKTQSFIIEEGKTDQAAVQNVLEKNQILSHPTLFRFLFGTVASWQKIKPGKYDVKHAQSIWSIARMLKNGQLAQSKLVINKLRTKEDLAKLISKNFQPDSVAVMQFLQSNDSLQKYGVDTSTVFTLIIPDTYSFYWNTSLTKIFTKLAEVQKIMILASIVEEETNYDADKYKIASVYLNRLQKSMALQACPTIKFAMKDFTLTRIYEKYLQNPSPYNTYRLKGLPPGPICTPSPKTIDIVLDAPATDYLFFVAKSDFSGFHHFSSNFAEHSQYAKEYQKALDIYMARKKLKEQTP